MNSIDLKFECYCHLPKSHLGVVCPKIKSIEYYQDGSIKKLELHP